MKKINENTKVTLTVAQLKKLVKESTHLSPWERRKKQQLFIAAINKLHFAIGSLEALAKDPDITQFYKKAYGVELDDAIAAANLTATYEWLEDFRNEYFGLK